MKRLTAIFITAALILACFSGGAFTAFADSLDRAMNAVRSELYGMYTLQSGNALRDRFDRAAALKAAGGTDNALAAALRDASDGLVPLENYGRVPLGGFGAVTAADISAMKLNRGGVTVSDGVIALSGEGALRYCNAVSGGVAGPSPFGEGVSAADGIALKITASAEASLDLAVGVRGGDNDRVFTLSDVAVSPGERYYFFPFGRFGGLPLDGTLNYVSLTFTGANEVSFGDLHGVAGALDGADADYCETPATPLEIGGGGYFKLLQKDSSLALTMLSPTETGDRCCAFTESDPDDDRQLWLICRDTYSASSAAVRVINKHYAFALRFATQGSGTVFASRPNLTASDQTVNYSYKKSRGFSFTVGGTQRLAYTGASLKLVPTTNPIKYFDVVSVPSPEWSTVWRDEFDGDELDRNIWNVRDGVVDGDENCYAFRDSEENVYLQDGNLVIHTMEGAYRGRPATSGHVSTEDNVQFGYGRYEFRVKMPHGQGIFPALWMMGNDDLWPLTGEIDILEMVGSGPGDGWKDDKKAIATFHYADENGEHREIGGYSTEGFLYCPERLSEDYHVYAVEWEKNQLRWYFDDLLYLTVNVEDDALASALQENPMFLRINVALHGPGNYQLPENMEEAFTYVDYVRYMKPRYSAAPQSGILFDRTVSDHDYSREFWYPANAGAVTAAQDKLVYATGASDVKIFGVNGMTELYNGSFGSDSFWIKSCAVSADGSRVAVGYTGGVGAFNGRLSVSARADFASNAPVVALSADGSRCYAGGQSNDSSDFCDYFYVYNASNMRLIKSEYTGSWVDSIAVHGGGVYAYGCYDGSVRVRSASDEDLGGFTAGGRVISIAFSPDGKKLYTADGGCNIYAYDIASGAASLLASLGDEAYRLAVSPDGTRLAAACGDSCARVYDLESGRLAARPCLGSLFVTAVSYSVDGRLLLLGGTDGRIGVFRADDGHPLALLTENGRPRWFDTLALSADNSVLMSVRRIYDYRSGPIAWRLPADLIPEDGGVSSALEALPCYDETAYTAESYAPYAAALKNARTVAANRYSAQSVIDSAARAVSEAAAALVEADGFMKGDADGDGEITVSDALCALRFAARLAEADERDLLVCDVDGDGEITVSDALTVLRAAVGLTTL